MNLNGNLRDFSALNVMMFLKECKKTGELEFNRSDRQQIKLYFRQGQLVSVFHNGASGWIVRLLNDRRVEKNDLKKELNIHRQQSQSISFCSQLTQSVCFEQEHIDRLIHDQIRVSFSCITSYVDMFFCFNPLSMFNLIEKSKNLNCVTIPNSLPLELILLECSKKKKLAPQQEIKKEEKNEKRDGRIQRRKVIISFIEGECHSPQFSSDLQIVLPYHKIEKNQFSTKKPLHVWVKQMDSSYPSILLLETEFTDEEVWRRYEEVTQSMFLYDIESVYSGMDCEIGKIILNKLTLAAIVLTDKVLKGKYFSLIKNKKNKLNIDVSREVASRVWKKKAEYSLEKKRLDLAIKNINQALHLDPSESSLYLLKGKIILQQAVNDKSKSYDLAEHWFFKSIEINSKCYESYYYLGISYKIRGFLNKAKQKFLTALEINKQFYPAQFALYGAEKPFSSNEKTFKARSK